jgi:hypothetical protein
MTIADPRTGQKVAPDSSSTEEEQASESAKQQRLDELLERAAGISAADLICHRDAWAFIVEQAAQNSHFRVPGLAALGDDDEQTNVTISGRTVIAILSALHVTQQSPAAPREDRALASTYFSRIATAINNAMPSQGDAARTRIIIDDRPPLAPDSSAD